MRLKTTFLLLLLIYATFVASKRSRGRGRGSSSGSSGFWNRKKSSSDSKPKSAGGQQAQPAKPKEPEITRVQQSSPSDAGRPIGWNVDNSKTGAVQKQNVKPSHSAYPQQSAPPAYNPHGAPPAYNQHGAPPAYNQHNTGGYSGYNYGQQGSYPGYGQHGSGSYPGYGQHSSGGYPSYGQHSPGSYPGYGQHSYPGQSPVGGYGGYPGHSPVGGYGGYPQQTGMFGGHQGYGGYGGFGGSGGYGGYPMKQSSGFFGKHAFRNILGGLAVGYLVSGLITTPFRIYSYMNHQPRDIVLQQEIKLPANVLTLCSENATSICAPGTVAICTSDNRILCVTSMTSATPCKDANGVLCAHSEIPCLDNNDPLCANKTSDKNTASIDLPCFTNVTLDSLPPNSKLPDSEGNKFCVTTMAVPDPTLPAANSTEMVNGTNVTPPFLNNGTDLQMQNDTIIPPPMWYPPPPIHINGTENQNGTIMPPPIWYPPPPMYWGYAPGFMGYSPPFFGYPPTNITLPINTTSSVAIEEISDSPTEVSTSES